MAGSLGLRRIVAIAVLAVSFCGAMLAMQKSESQVITVTGRGATAYEAREDAIRQALQQAVKQLVLAQRVVQNDKLALDQIASTMNGYVNRFTPKSTTKVDGVITVEAEVEVSESRVENFLATTTGGQTQINANNILADAQREALARKTRAEMLVGLFGSFPQGALEASAPTVKINDENPSMMDVEFRAWISPLFIKHLKAGLQALGATRIKSPVVGASAAVCFSDFGDFGLSELYTLRGFGLSGLYNVRSQVSSDQGFECWLLAPSDLSAWIADMDPSDGARLYVLGGLLVLKSNGEYQPLNTERMNRKGPAAFLDYKERDSNWTCVLAVGEKTIRLQLPVDQLQKAGNQQNVEMLAIPMILERSPWGNSYPFDAPAFWSLLPRRVVRLPLPMVDFQQLMNSFVQAGPTAGAKK